MAARETFSSKLGTLMVLVGSAVGLGNIWRFPFLVGKYGAPFLLCYILCMLLLSIPILNCELILGRFSRSNAYRAFKEHGRRSVWKLVGIVTLTVPFLIFSYYCVVGGWTLDYLVKSLTFQFAHSSHEQIAAMFTALSTSTWIPLIWTLVFFLATAGVIVIGVKGGIENFSKYMMPVLFLIIVGLTVWVLTLPGASKGLDLMFNLGSTPFGVETIVVAMGQSFYSMSLGAGVMITYGSYMAEDENILASSFKTAFFDFLFALVASMAMLPATCAFGYDPGQGASLAFNTMPMIFAKMPGGSICAIVFFLALVIAALTSTVSLMEANIAFFVDEKKMGRIKAACIVLAGAIVIGALSSLSYGPLANFKIFGLTIFNAVDQLCANLLMPICGLFGCLFVGWQLSKKDVRAELTNNGTLSLPGKSFNLLYFIIRYVAPILLIMVMVANFHVGSTE